MSLFCASRKFKLLVLVMLSFGMLGLSACGKKMQVSVEASTQSLYTEFYTVAESYGLKLDSQAVSTVIVTDLEKDVLGLCSINENDERTIKINGNTWQDATDAERRFVIFHELGHCALNLDHRDDTVPFSMIVNGSELSYDAPATLMATTVSGFDIVVIANNWKLYTDELFTQKAIVLPELEYKVKTSIEVYGEDLRISWETNFSFERATVYKGGTVFDKVDENAFFIKGGAQYLGKPTAPSYTVVPDFTFGNYFYFKVSLRDQGSPSNSPSP